MLRVVKVVAAVVVVVEGDVVGGVQVDGGGVGAISLVTDVRSSGTVAEAYAVFFKLRARWIAG